MGYAEQRSAIVTHVGLATASVNAAFTDVDAGFPFPRGTMAARVWFGGAVHPAHMGSDDETLNSEMKGTHVNIALWWPVPDAGETAAAADDDELAAVEAAIRTRLNADITLGGNATALRVDDSSATFDLIKGITYLCLDMGLVVDYLEYSKHA